MTPELIIAIEACMKAGHRIVRSGCGASLQGVGDEPSPWPDDVAQDANLVITRTLSATGLPLLSGYGDPVARDPRSSWHQYWLVCPLDDQEGMESCSGEYAVSVALVEGHEAVLGVVYAPSRDELFCASRESGAFRVRQTSTPHARTQRLVRPSFRGSADGRPCRVLVGRSTDEGTLPGYMEGLCSRVGAFEVVPTGGALKFCLIAAGEADLYPCLGTSFEWETAAGHAILKAVGRNVVDIRTGRELAYNKEEMVNPCFIAR
jgi:3'(2'), 5'-bisphosphate nucleotidase